MHEKSVVDGSSGRGLRGSDRPFVRWWNRVGKQRRFGACTSPLWSSLVMCPLVLSCLILCWLLSLWSSLDLACLVFVFCGIFLSCPVFSSLGPSVLSLGASWKPLSASLGGPFGPPGALRGPLETDCGRLDGPWSLQPVPVRPWALLGGPWAALGGS